MQPPEINLAEMKDRLTKKLGPDRSKQYLDYLNRFLSFKLSKIEFDKLCLRTIGRENISLHNRLIRSILKNACTRKSFKTAGNKNESCCPNGDTSSRKLGILLHPPLGIPCCPVSTRGARRGSSDGLLETIRLKDRMAEIVAAQDLQGVSMDCANVVNNGLDAYLKGLIRAFTGLNRARYGLEPAKNGPTKPQGVSRPLNGVRHSNYYHWGSGPMQEQGPKRVLSLLDFRVAVELDPHRLGGDWPVLMEKICGHDRE